VNKLKYHKVSFPAPAGPIEPDQINKADREALAQLAEGRKVIIEIGTYLGGSAEVFLDNMDPEGVLVTIDTYAGSGLTGNGEKFNHLQHRYAADRLRRYGKRAILINADSIMVSSFFQTAVADLLFIDGGHDYHSCLNDIKHWSKVVKDDGTISGHDFDMIGNDVVHDLSKEELGRRSLSDWDPLTKMHLGVRRAVAETFCAVSACNLDHPMCTVWYAKKSDLRG
jgi:predicted O-methyltransferase YrrM